MSQSLNPPLVWAEISLQNLRHNLRLIQKKVGPNVDVMAIVKADAYGHGMGVISKELYRSGVRFFGVATLQEASDLLAELPRVKILVLGSFHRNQLKEYIRLGVRPTLSSIEDAKLFAHAVLKSRKKKFPVHIKIDTGMGRLGIWHEEAGSFLNYLTKSQKLFVEGMYTHFAAADSSVFETKKQISAFEAIISMARGMQICPRYLHAANSMGLAHFEQAHLNLVRPGIILYGINPADRRGQELRGLKPVLSLKTRITFLKKIPKGRAVSYGSTYRASKETQIATLPIGYSHGYRVGFSNRADVLIGGRRCPVVGRVTMNQTLVDATSVPDLKRWGKVTIVGMQASEQISAEELAGLIGTIPYEIVCGIASRIPRLTSF